MKRVMAYEPSGDYQQAYQEGYRNGARDKETALQVHIEKAKNSAIEAQRMKNVLSVMYQISELSHDTNLDVDEMYEGIHSVLSQIIDTTNFYIARVDAKAKLLRFVIFRDEQGPGFEQPSDFPTRPISRRFTELVIERQKPVLLSYDEMQLMCAKKQRDNTNVRAQSWLGVPLIVEEEVMGVMALQSYKAAVMFDQSDVELLTFVSQNISHAIIRHDQQLKKHVEIQRLEKVSQTDMLTGLLNRYAFYMLLERTFQEQKSELASIALLYIDVDGFKQVNDLYGHATGDRILMYVAEILKAEVRDGDAVCRLGGDEFVVMLANLINKNQAETITQRVLDKLSYPINVDGSVISISVSVGITLASEKNISPQNAINQADAAMYKKKQQGKNGYYIL